jgi:NAD(P)-dependent dehydrogenase (short-subunit alcohol dehydrogenase family)
VALVVGGSKGIGRAIALAFAGEGADVAVVGRTRNALDATATALAESGVRTLAVAADVGMPQERERVVPRVIEELGRVDILVNCAGAKPLRGDMLDREPGVLKSLIDVNVLPYYDLTIAAARGMRDRGWGRVINISSATGLKARSGMGEYAITKAAEIMMTRAFAVELGEHGITVNAIAPILTRTEFSSAQLRDESDVERVLRVQAIKRIAEPEDVVGAALLLASDAGSFITGTTISVDGGALA